MINTQYLVLPLSRTYFHGSKGVPAIEVRLYNVKTLLHGTVVVGCPVLPGGIVTGGLLGPVPPELQKQIPHGGVSPT